MKKMRTNNRGFSLVELIVIMAIMTVAVGAITLSVSLITGSEAKKAARKTDSILNEVKTGAMSRFDEDFTITYKLANTASTGSGASGDFDKDGFYAVKKVTTLTYSGTASGGGADSVREVFPDERVLGVENRILCDNRVQIELTYVTTSGAGSGSEDIKKVTVDGAGSNETKAVTIKYDRATGKYAGVMFEGEDPVGDIVNIKNRVPKELSFESGMRKYRILFNSSTGRHTLETN